MTIIQGLRGYPGQQGLTGIPGQQGNQGVAGPMPIVVDNGNGTITVTGSNGSVIIRNGQDGVSPPANSGDYISVVYAQVPNDDPVPTITPGTGTYDGTNEVMPTGSTTWQTTPPFQAGYTSYVSLNRYIHDASTGGNGTWSLLTPNWSVPVVYQINNAQSNRFTSYIFFRDSNAPATPTGGSYAFPVASGWSDGIPAGTNPVYISKRIFTEDGLPPQEATWSVPALLGAAGTGSKFQFGPTSSGPWSDTPSVTDEWMVACTMEPGQAWVCDYLNPVKIVGEMGPEAQSKFLATAFKRSDTDLAALNAGNGEIPEGGNFDAPFPVDNLSVSGWSRTIPPGTSNLFISNRVFTTDGLAPQDANWSGARLFDGQNAVNFVLTADSQTFAYDEEDPPGITPSQINFTVNKQHVGNDTVWTTDPVITVADNTGPKETLVITAAEFDAAGTNSIKVTATAGTYSDSTTIVKISDGYTPVAGLDYSDGISIFQSKIYKSSISNPGIPQNGSYDGTNETVPSGWSEDPLAPAGPGHYVWESSFLYQARQVDGVNTWDTQVWPGPSGGGGTWSTPVKYSYIPTEGTDFFNNNSFQSYIFRNVVVGTTPSTPSGGTYDGTTEDLSGVGPGTWTDDPITPDDDEITWVSNRLYEFDGSTWSHPAWSTPSKFSGSASLTGVLTNEVDSVFADVTGDPTFDGNEGGEFLVYFGTEDVTGACTFAVSGGSTNGGWHERTVNGLRFRIDRIGNFAGQYNLSENANWTSDKETFTIIATHSSGFIVTKKYTLSKSKEGAAGIQGTSTRIDFAYGTSSSGGSVNYPSVSFGPPRVYTTASSTNKTFIGTNAVTWEPTDTAPAYGEPSVSTNSNDYEWSEFVGDAGADGQSTRLDIAYADNFNGVTASGNLRFPSNSSNPTPATPASTNRFIGTDVVTWTGTAPNASQNQATYEWTRYQGDDGQSGVDALSIVLSNPSHSVPCTPDGNVSDYNNSGTVLSVYEGPVALDSVTDASTATMSNGEFRLVSAVQSGGITVDSTPAYTGDPITFGAISNWAAGTGNLTAKITYTVEGKTQNGTVFSGIIAEQTFNKNLGGGGVGVSQISTNQTGTIHGSSVTVTHPSQGGTITVNWNAFVGSFPPLGGSSSYGNDEPTGTVNLLLKKDGTTIATETFTISTFSEDDGPAWTAFRSLVTDTTSGTSGNIEFRIEWSGDTSSNILTQNAGYISITENV